MKRPVCHSNRKNLSMHRIDWLKYVYRCACLWFT